MRLSLLLASLTLMSGAAMAQAATSPIVPQGVDLEFTCSSSGGERVSCLPQSGRHGRYARLANWRIVDESMMGACLYGATYGYARLAPWVAGDCQATFRAPNLRFGDEYNAQRVPVYLTTAPAVDTEAPWWQEQRIDDGLLNTDPEPSLSERLDWQQD